MVCTNNMYLDIDTLTCVSSCPAGSIPIETSGNEFEPLGAGATLRFCRSPQTVNAEEIFTYYVDPTSISNFELGTIDYPMKKIYLPYYEVFNFLTDPTFKIEIKVKSGSTVWAYYELAPLAILGLESFTMTTYPDNVLANIYIDDTVHDDYYAGSQFAI